jgi:uncharacterized protein with PhoU and TrkA domain
LPVRAAADASIATTLRCHDVLATVVASSAHAPVESVVDAFVYASGTFSILAAIPLLYLAVRSVRDARHLKLIHSELVVVMRETKELAEELHALQREIRHEQREAKTDIGETRRTVEQVTEVVESAAGQVADAAMQVAEVAEKRSPFVRVLRRSS